MAEHVDGSLEARSVEIDGMDQSADRVLWLSLDPRSGMLVTFSTEDARKLESSFQHGSPSVKLEISSSAVCFHAQGPGRHQQHIRGEGEEEGGATDRECDVRRLTVRLSDAQVSLPAQKTSDEWQIADDADNETSSNEMRSLELTPEILQGREL
mmetsp:Transcript_11884/g.31266  ORF Transcript_11884/g.31266 Transcript_11884/m.31266 type:complete len:154 (+) Transcript_11884:60-521(+)